MFESRYGQPDPAFILPQIHDQEKGVILVTNEARRYRTKEVKNYPLAIPGRETTLFARIQNFGLETIASSIPVCFYYNTETDETLQFIGCDSITGGLVGRENDLGNEVASIDWTIPLALTAGDNPKIVAIIDPNNTIANEVHDYPLADGITNNIAWNCLYGTDCGDITDASKLFLDPCNNLSAVLTLDQTPITSGTYFATDKIIVSGTIPDGNVVILKAPNGVELLPTFDLSQGGIIEALIGTCN